MNNCKKLLYALFLCFSITQITFSSEKNDLIPCAYFNRESTLENLSRRFINGDDAIGIYVYCSREKRTRWKHLVEDDKYHYSQYRLAATLPCHNVPSYYESINEVQKQELFDSKKEKDAQKNV